MAHISSQGVLQAAEIKITYKSSVLAAPLSRDVILVTLQYVPKP